MKPVSWNPLICFPAAFSGNGIKGILMILLIAGAIFAYVKLHDKALARDFIWQVQLEKDVNGLWTATRILNFTDYLKERMDG